METNIYLELYKSERLLENYDQANLNKIMINFGLLHNAMGFAFIEIAKVMSYLFSTYANSNESSSAPQILNSKNSNEKIEAISNPILPESSHIFNTALPTKEKLKDIEVVNNYDELPNFKPGLFLLENLIKSDVNNFEIEDISNKDEKSNSNLEGLMKGSIKNIFEKEEKVVERSNERSEHFKENSNNKNGKEIIEILATKKESNEMLENIAAEKPSLLKYTKKFKKKKSDLEIEPILRKVKYEEGGNDPFLGRKEKKTFRLKKEEKIELSQIELGGRRGGEGRITGLGGGEEGKEEMGVGVKAEGQVEGKAEGGGDKLAERREEERFMSKVTKKIVDKNEVYRSTFRKKREREVLEGFSCNQCEKVFYSIYIETILLNSYRIS